MSYKLRGRKERKTKGSLVRKYLKKPKRSFSKRGDGRN